MQIGIDAQILKIIYPNNISSTSNAFMIDILVILMYKVISVAAVVAYFVPLIIVVLRNAWRDPFFKLFAIYWAIGGISS